MIIFFKKWSSSIGAPLRRPALTVLNCSSPGRSMVILALYYFCSCSESSKCTSSKKKILHLGCAVKFHFRTHRTITVREYQYSGKKESSTIWKNFWKQMNHPNLISSDFGCSLNSTLPQYLRTLSCNFPCKNSYFVSLYNLNSKTTCIDSNELLGTIWNETWWNEIVTKTK